jgi:hypothetical protein
MKQHTNMSIYSYEERKERERERRIEGKRNRKR